MLATGGLECKVLVLTVHYLFNLLTTKPDGAGAFNDILMTPTVGLSCCISNQEIPADWTDFLSVSHKTNEMLLKKTCRLLDKPADKIMFYGSKYTNDQFKLLH